MNRDAFFSRAAKLPTIDIKLDDETMLKARKLTQAEVETIRQKYGSAEKGLDGMRYIVSRTVVDESGERMFTDDDMRKMLEMDFDTISTIAKEVMKFSGLKVEDPKNA